MLLVGSVLRRLLVYRRSLVSAWGKTRARLTYYPHISIGVGVTLGEGVRLVATDGGRIDIGDHVTIHAGTLLQTRGGFITVGGGSFIGRHCTLVSTCEIRIGSNALVAEQVTIRDQQHGMAVGDCSFADQPASAAPVCLADNVWLAAGVRVTDGVVVGANTVVAANAVVTADLQGGALYGGVPARKLKSLELDTKVEAVPTRPDPC
ncbi:MAG: hypothetical protein AAGA91_13160 [Pseudomonadota bacterium]